MIPQAHEADARWHVRAERVFAALGECIRKVGGDPDALIPMDTFDFLEAPTSSFTPAPNADDDAEVALQIQQMEELSMNGVLD
jgi:hypothetical protein